MLLWTLFVCSVLASPTVQAEKPNVLFIGIDDLNDWIGCLNGHPQVQTPNIDRLAKRGVLFTNAHCAAPACNPSRAALFSGKMPYHTGVWSNSSPRLPQHRPSLVLLPQAFRTAGYLTLGTGKLLHGGPKSNRRLFERGYFPEQRWSPFTRQLVEYTADELPSKATDQPRHIVAQAGRAPAVLPLNRMPSDRAPTTASGESFDWGPVDVGDADMGDAQITDWAISQLRKSSGKPFLLCVGYYRPHIPLWAPRRYFEMYPPDKVQLPPFLSNDLQDLSDVAQHWALEPVTAGAHTTVVRHQQWRDAVSAYLACVSFIDHQVGRLIDALDASPAAANTVIVLWSDHGWHLGEKQHWGKWTGWERSTRVPLIIVQARDGNDARAGTRCAQPVGLVDLYPTLSELCALETPEDLDGRSLVPLLLDPNAETGRAVVTTFDKGNVTLRTNRWRYIHYSDGSEELYDHAADPNEWRNLGEDPARREFIEQLRRRIPRAAL